MFGIGGIDCGTLLYYIFEIKDEFIIFCNNIYKFITKPFR